MPRAPSKLDRRDFLMAASASALALGWHDHANAGAIPSHRQPSPGEHRLRSLRLVTSTPLDEMRRYYEQTLELPVRDTAENEITIDTGATPLTYTKAAPEFETPWYHIAFDIPENKLFLARDWLLERTNLKQRRPGPETHPDYPDVANFHKWNAHSVFFWDPAGNLLEYIARHTLKNARKGAFTPDDVLHASEIGLMVDDVKPAAEGIRHATGLSDYIGMNDHFHPLGDHHGLVILFNKGRNWRQPDGTTRPTGSYPTEITLHSEFDRAYEVPGQPYRIRPAT